MDTIWKEENKQTNKKISVCIQAPTAHSMSTYVIDRNKQIYNKYTPQNSCHFQNKKKNTQFSHYAYEIPFFD